MAITVHDFYPPLMQKIYDRAVYISKGRPLFEGSDQMFKKYVANAAYYGEYGMGASTRWVLTNTSADVIAVDTAKSWVDHVRDANPSKRLNAVWVDVGPVGEWGRPITYERRDAFREYVMAPFSGHRKPDVILVDGRFRVACFLASLLNSPAGTTIIFDDYADRGYYHIVEEFAPRQETCGRQGRFVVPPDVDREKASTMMEHFLFVIE